MNTTRSCFACFLSAGTRSPERSASISTNFFRFPDWPRNPVRCRLFASTEYLWPVSRCVAENSQWLAVLSVIVAASFLCGVPSRLRAADEAPLPLAEAVRLAVARHQDVAKARAAAEALKGKIQEVRAQALPDVKLESNVTRWRDPSLLNASGLDKFPEELRSPLVPSAVNLFDYAVTVKQPLFTQGKVRTALRLASIEAEGAVSEIDRAEQDVALAATKAFYGLLWAERYRTLVAETQEQKKLHAAMARTRFQNGVATEVDVLRSEVDVANGGPDLVRAGNAIKLARAELNYYLG